MVELIKKFTKLTGEFFDFSKKNDSAFPNTSDSSVLKTRAQLIEEGRGAYLPKRHIHGVPHLLKKD